jgi:GTP-binding nuclear protein Ran
MSRFKIVLIGDGGVGKSAFVARHVSDTFSTSYGPTLGVDVQSVTFNTSYGQIVFDLWDTAGQEKFSGMRDGYYIGANAAIVMFDVGSLLSRKNIKTWIDLYTKIAPNTPVFVCGSKIDAVMNRVASSSSIVHTLQARGIDCAYGELSAKINHNCRSPFLWLARKLAGHDDLVFV